MTCTEICKLILRTRSLDHTLIAVAATLAPEYSDCRADVEAWWLKQGGRVEPEPSAKEEALARMTRALTG